MKHEVTMFQLAQEITDEVLGKGTYKRLNKFDPSKGETRQHLGTEIAYRSGNVQTKKENLIQMQPDNKAAYADLLKAQVDYRTFIATAADSPIPGDTWHDIGRAMELLERVRIAIKPKGA